MNNPRSVEVKRDNSGTRFNLIEAGISDGMSVLELGCGAGEVTEILCELVGPSGRVTAVDRSRTSLDSAVERLNGAGVSNFRLIHSDIADLENNRELQEDSPFDAVAGRRVLMYLKDPSSALKSLLPYLWPGALAVFEEAGFSDLPRSMASMPAHDKAMSWLLKMLDHEGATADMGFHLPSLLDSSGFEPMRIKGEAVLQGQGGHFPVSSMLKAMESRVIASGAAGKEEIDQLGAALDEENRDRSMVYVINLAICAWGRKRGSSPGQ